MAGPGRGVVLTLEVDIMMKQARGDTNSRRESGHEWHQVATNFRGFGPSVHPNRCISVLDDSIAYISYLFRLLTLL